MAQNFQSYQQLMGLMTQGRPANMDVVAQAVNDLQGQSTRAQHNNEATHQHIQRVPGLVTTVWQDIEDMKRPQSTTAQNRERRLHENDTELKERLEGQGNPSGAMT